MSGVAHTDDRNSIRKLGAAVRSYFTLRLTRIVFRTYRMERLGILVPRNCGKRILSRKEEVLWTSEEFLSETYEFG